MNNECFKHCFDTTTLRISYSSLVMPSSIYDVNLDTLALTLLKQTAILGGFDTTNYVSSFLHATAPDGTRVPVSIVHHKDTPINGTAPCLLYGYGSYGITIPVQFQSSLVSLLDRGFVYAIGHIRGGGDLGKTWHDAGKMQHKQNTFSDFIAVGDFLKSEGYSHPRRLAIRGGSAGGRGPHVRERLGQDIKLGRTPPPQGALWVRVLIGGRWLWLRQTPFGAGILIICSTDI